MSIEERLDILYQICEYITNSLKRLDSFEKNGLKDTIIYKKEILHLKKLINEQNRLLFLLMFESTTSRKAFTHSSFGASKECASVRFVAKTSSGIASETTQCSPDACASIFTIPKPSYNDGKKKASIPW